MSMINIQSENIMNYEFLNYVNFIKQSANPEVYLHSFKVLMKKIAKNGGLDSQDENGLTPLMYLCFHLDNIVFYETILSFHPKLDLKKHEGRTALMLACDYKRYDVIKLLLDSGADINVIYNTEPDQYGHRIRFLVGFSDDAIVYFDGSCVSSIFIKNMEDNGLDHGIAELLLSYDINRDNLNKTLIELAGNGNIDTDDLITILMKKGAEINFQSSNGNTALMEACFSSNVKLVKRLLSYSADINIKNSRGATALLYACGHCTDEIPDANNLIIPLLLNLKPDFDVEASDCFTTPLLYYASQNNCNIEILKVLCDKSNLHYRDKYGKNALILQCAYNKIVDLEVVKTLLLAGIDINSQDDKGRTALLVTKFTEDNYDVIKFLLDHNANINLYNKEGNTALMLASKDNKVDLVQLFLDYGAQLNYGPKTAYELTTDPYIKSLIKRYLPQNSYQRCEIKQCSKCSDVNTSKPCHESICYADAHAKHKKYVQLHCSHVFHYICIDRWLCDQRSCPECRAMIY
jgi:ankyrin repeat protein